jgi:hypothetical protein
MTTPGFDHGVAIAPRRETRSKSDVKRDGDRQWGRGGLQESRIHHNSELMMFEDFRIRVNHYWDAIRFTPPFELIHINQPRLDPLDTVPAFVDCLGKRNSPAHGKRLRKFRDGNTDPCPMQA